MKQLNTSDAESSVNAKVMKKPKFAVTFPKLDGVSYYCITGNLE